MNRLNFKKSAIVLGMCSLAVLGGCSDNDSLPPVETTPTPPAVVTQDYTVTVTNLTPSQPLSPIAVVAHNADNPIFSAGTEASVALENLAEAGDNSDLESEDGVSQLVSGAGILAAGSSESLTVTFNQDEIENLSILTMLVNTNDAFTGVSNFDPSSLEVGDKMTFRANVYDSGTEANSEAKGTIPGPADSGEGFNPSREGDVNKVHIHPGVITQDDGLADSVLKASDRFDNPAMKVVIERTK
ncbi:hypothetical protein D5R81_00850 [Parashewanella spongiae]|uniref:Spondin domain-containing protein n=1 Tax=Parashewanella spongiae TaxID=342950 RepID=A0A3A6U1S0_9GAMM|nr:spondin domain-containing protein [Parashewanella spongiae]MCL1078691.1 spondin domain-containing protein [Parashewanella spongiae]RJY19400.1 hypothetical protein D5R81_00850 [Parashewanella spongiae]